MITVNIPEQFPKWKPTISTVCKMKSNDIKVRKKCLRNSASNFIKRKDVRKYIFSHKGIACYLCGKTATQIDHKISAYQFAINRDLDFMQMNSFENLYPICVKCNTSKLP